MQGYVSLQLLDGNREPIPTDVVRGPGNETLVTLAAGAQAYTTLHWGAVASGNEPTDRPCQPDSVQVEITPPNETASLMLPWTFGSVCAQGRVETVPVQSGGG